MKLPTEEELTHLQDAIGANLDYESLLMHRLIDGVRWLREIMAEDIARACHAKLRDPRATVAEEIAHALEVRASEFPVCGERSALCEASKIARRIGSGE